MSAETLWNYSNTGNVQAIVTLLTAANGTGSTFPVVFSGTELGLPAGGSVTLSVTGNAYAYEETVGADTDGMVRFAVPYIPVGTEIEVCLTVKDAGGAVVYAGSKTQLVESVSNNIAVVLTGGLSPLPPAPVLQLGSKDAPDAVGDIVFNDGSVSPYTDFDTTPMTAEQAAAAVAVIYDAVNKKGVGLKQGTNLKWASSGTPAYTTTIVALRASCLTGSNANNSTWSGATDGSTSLTKFRTYVGATPGVPLNSTNYPMWAFVEGYAATAGLTGDYADGWYIPSIQELCKLYQTKTIVKNALSKIPGAEQLSNSSYWSSSDYDLNGYQAWPVSFSNGSIQVDTKSYRKEVCVIRAF